MPAAWAAALAGPSRSLPAALGSADRSSRSISATTLLEGLSTLRGSGLCLGGPPQQHHIPVEAEHVANLKPVPLSNVRDQLLDLRH